MARSVLCPHGHPVDPGLRFCRVCGASVVAGSVSGATRNSNAVIYAVAGVVIVLGLVAIVVALLLGSGGGSQKPPGTSLPTGVVTTPGPTATRTTPGSSPSPPPSSTVSGGPAGGRLCSGTVNGLVYGTIGSMTSCDFAGAVYQAYAAAGSAQGQPLTATSPVTHKTYTNIVCTASGRWITCVGAENNTAQVFFAAQ